MKPTNKVNKIDFTWSTIARFMIQLAQKVAPDPVKDFKCLYNVDWMVGHSIMPGVNMVQIYI